MFQKPGSDLLVVNMSEGDLLQEKEEELIFMEALEAHIRNIENEDISVQETELVNCVLLEQEVNIKNTENEDPNQIVEKEEEEGCPVGVGAELLYTPNSIGV
ncbi:hypothetical protein LIER_07072 [Lithospermum erythrorhizon]|uniref:Uncharacterized protein n=1 Tax=Lithospermum erythrorhizon TaxID=34254 RepID=A0AAV3PAM7_LITER